MKIALIAMSGIRCCDQELMDMGLTLPGFVDRSKIIAALPSLGLLTLAGMTPNEHQVDYIEIFDIKDTKAADSIPQGYDLVAISSYGAQIAEAYELGDIYKASGMMVVQGGLHVSACPEEAILHADAVAIGEGEPVWADILKDAERRNLRKFYKSDPRAFSLDDAPMPAYELLDIDKYNRLTIQTSRGCPRSCEFCASSVLLTNTYKQKPADKVLAEIDRICDIWQKPFIEFADDNTFVNASYWEDILPKMESRKLRWFTETDISIAKHPELLRLMRKSGCAQILIGLESPLEKPLDGIEKNNNWKLKQWPDYKKAIETIQSYGISVNGCFVIGLDGQTPDIFDAIYDFVCETELHEVQITLQTAFPGTKLYDRLRAEKRLIDETAWEKLTLFDVNFIPSHMTQDELRKGFYSLAEKMYSEEFTSLRKQKFMEKIRAYQRKIKEN
ncbi:MAG: radical SAM protein [Candidatus Zixiibacteriota bacterium]